jgi:hypothetical protein
VSARFSALGERAAARTADSNSIMRFAFCSLGPMCVLLLAALGCSSGAPSVGSATSTDIGEALCTPDEHPPSPLSLLTRTQYDATIADLLSDTSQPSATFPAENQVGGFNNNTEVHIANPLLVEQFMDAAEGIANRAVTANLATLAPCSGQSASEQVQCGADFVTAFGKRAFRRPLLADEADAFNALFTAMNTARGYSVAVELTIQALLESPQFLYRVDSSRAATSETGAVALDNYQMASRLSYFLTGSMPDEALFAAADAGQLLSSDEIETQARRLLETPRARAMVRDFNSQWLHLDELSGLARNLPDASTDVKGIGDDYRESLERFLDRVYWDKGDLKSLFLAPEIFVNARLASVVGGAADATGDFAEVAGAPGRVGLLTQPGLMAMLAHSDQSGPVQRGVFVLERILCIDVPPPPPNFNPIPPDPDPNLTTRERFKVHTAAKLFAGCHKVIDGAGFGFENYDQLGRYRSTENGLPVDASGEMIGTQEAGLDGVFTGAAELSQRLAKSVLAERCLSKNWYRYAMGRVETEADGCSLGDVQQKFVASGGQLKELLVALTLTDAFRYRPAVPEDQ